jgi:hypothetical protein
MSLYGALRMFIVGERGADDRTPTPSTDEELAPIRPGAWKAWARAHTLEDARGDVAKAAAGRVGPSVRPVGGAARVPDAETARDAVSPQPGIELL